MGLWLQHFQEIDCGRGSKLVFVTLRDFRQIGRSQPLIVACIFWIRRWPAARPHPRRTATPAATGLCPLPAYGPDDGASPDPDPASGASQKRFRAQFGVDEMRARLIPLCRLCHNAVHEFIPSEKQLAEEYNTVEALLAHEGIARHVAWARKQQGESSRSGFSLTT